MTRPTVLLFDIDGTLVSFRGVGRRAFERAFDLEHGRPDAVSALRFDGSTDRATTRLALEGIGISATETLIDALLTTYLRELEAELSVSSPETYQVHRGVHAALSAASARGLALGVGTGNIEAGARLKLAHVGLWEHFAFGGFGSDHELRLELIRVGAERGAHWLGRTRDACRVVVIGDTPKDIDAARGIGAECIGVGTGSFSAAQLLEHGASAAFDDLTTPGALAALLGD